MPYIYDYLFSFESHKGQHIGSVLLQYHAASIFLQVFCSLQNIKQLISGSHAAACGLGHIENPHGDWKNMGFSSQGATRSIRHLHGWAEVKLRSAGQDQPIHSWL